MEKNADIEFQEEIMVSVKKAAKRGLHPVFILGFLKLECFNLELSLVAEQQPKLNEILEDFDSEKDYKKFHAS